MPQVKKGTFPKTILGSEKPFGYMICLATLPCDEGSCAGARFRSHVPLVTCKRDLRTCPYVARRGISELRGGGCCVFGGPHLVCEPEKLFEKQLPVVSCQ